MKVEKRNPNDALWVLGKVVCHLNSYRKVLLCWRLGLSYKLNPASFVIASDEVLKKKAALNRA